MRGRALFGVAWLFLMTVSGRAESAKLTGQVLDGSQAVIAGATLTLMNGDAVVAEGATAENGTFELTAPAGPYVLQVFAPGFEPAVLTVDVRENAAAPAVVTLSLASIESMIVVEADRDLVTLDADNNLSAVILDEEMIAALPDDEEALAAYLTELAGPRAAAAGGVQFAVDGFSGGRLPPKDQIQQIRINNNPYTAEFGRPGFGRIEIITRAGGGEFRANATLAYRDDALNARNALASDKPDFQQKNVQFNIGGPLLANRLSASVFVQRNDQTSTDSINAFTLDGPLTDFVIRPSIRQTYGVRGQYQTGENHTLTFSLQSGSTTRENTGAGGFTLVERGSTSKSTQNSLQLRETGVLSPNWIYETRFEASREHSRTTGNSEGVAINVLDSFFAGGAQSEGEERTDGLMAAQSFMYNRGNVTLKTGIEWNYSKLRSVTENNYNGVYVFSSLDAYRAGAPATFTITRGNPLIETDMSRFAVFAQSDFKVGSRLVVSPGVRYQAQTHLADYNNLAPRISFAYQLDTATVVRGGAGVFHQELSSNILANVLRLDGTRQIQLVIRNPLFPDALADTTGATTISPAIRVMAEDLAAPYTVNGSLSLERAFSSGTVMTTAYDYIRGISLYRSRDIDPSLNSVYQLESSGLSTFQGMTFGLRQRLGTAVNVSSSYTYAFSFNDTEGAFSLPADSFNLASEWGRAADDRRHQFSSAVTLRLPWDVSLNTMLRAQSGRPYNITTGFDDNGDAVTNDRPAGVDRNSGNGPSFFDVGFNLSKTFRLAGDAEEPPARPSIGMGGGPGGRGGMGPGMGPGNSGGRSMTLFVNVQNLLNKTNFANYSGVMTSPLFGQATSALNSREVELGLRFNF